MVINLLPSPPSPSSNTKSASLVSSVSISTSATSNTKMSPLGIPKTFDICLISGIIFNFACVTAQYWPPGHTSSSYQSPYGQYGQGQSGYSGYQVSSGPIRVQSSVYGHQPQTPTPYGSPAQRFDQVYPSAATYQPQPLGTYQGAQSNNYGQSMYGHSWSSPSTYQQQRPYDYSGYQRPPVPQPYYPPRQQTQVSSSWYNRPPSTMYQPSPTSPYYNEIDRRFGWPQQQPPMSYMPMNGMYGPPPSMYPQPPRMPTTAIAKMKSASNKVDGEIRLVQADNRYIQLTGRINGLIPGAHGLHIHEGANSGGDTCANIGGHYNPLNVDHGGKSEWIRHVGDLGNIFADHDGSAFFDITDSMITLIGANSIVNRTIVVTEFGDDLGKGSNEESKKTGNSGKPLACGIITLTSPVRF